MARIRSIKPEIASDAKLARHSRGTRYHFVLLWTVADDAGFFRASPRQLLGQLYPHDRDIGEADVNRMTAELVEAGFLSLHQTDDGPIGCVVNWSKHQKIDRPSRSHLREECAKPSREPREGPSEGVLSPDLGVLSPDRPEDGDAATDYARQITAAANRATRAKWNQEPYMQGTTYSFTFAQELMAAGIPLPTATQRLVDQVAALGLERPPRNIRYFLPGILEPNTASARPRRGKQPPQRYEYTPTEGDPTWAK